MRWPPIFLVAAIVVAVALPVFAGPQLTFDKDTAVASGITAGGQAAWFSIAWDRWHATNRVTRRDRIDTDSGSGEVRFHVEGGVPENSVWVVVDLASGEYAAACPEETRLRLGELPSTWIERGGGASDIVKAERAFLEILVVRPGVGVWGVSVGHGGASDVGEGADAYTRASLAAMRTMGGATEAPPRFANGDIVVVIDPNSLECLATRLAPAQ